MIKAKGLAALVAAGLTIGVVSGCGREHKGKDEPSDNGGNADGDDGSKGGSITGGEKVAANVAGGNDAVANFRGFYAINDIVEQRLMKRDGSFFLGHYLDDYYEQDLFGLPQLLGYEVGTGTIAEFRNGKANAIN